MDNLHLFATSEIKITELSNFIFLPDSSIITMHRDRHSSGLALQTLGTSIFDFHTGKDPQPLTHGTGEIIFLPKASTYEEFFVNNNRTECYVLNFDIECPQFEQFVFHPKNYNSFLNSFQLLEHIWAKKSPNYYEQCFSELYKVIYMMKNEISSSYVTSDKQRLLEPAVEYIHLHYIHENLQIAELASMCGISEVYFRKIFKMIYKCSPKDYIDNLKLSRALELIKSREYSVGEISEMCGFYSDSYFCKKFKNKFGMAPSKYK